MDPTYQWQELRGARQPRLRSEAVAGDAGLDLSCWPRESEKVCWRYLSLRQQISVAGSPSKRAAVKSGCYRSHFA